VRAAPPPRPGGDQASAGRRTKEVTGMRYRLEVRLTPADIGKRVVIRWRPPGPEDGKQMTDVLGILEQADDQSFTVRRTRDGQRVVVPRERALAGKVVPPARPRRRPS
jgi:N-acetylglutamate synthase